jgi:N utilization substance protein A
MFDLKTIIASIRQIAEEREVPEQRVQEIIETAFAHAYKKEYREKNEVVRAKFNPETGDVLFFLVKTVVDDSMIQREGEEAEEDPLATSKKIVFSPERHIMLEEARQINPNIFSGEELEFPLEQKLDFGRIAAQTAKQVLLQKLHEIEKETVFDYFKNKEGDIVSGIIQRLDGRNIYVDLGKTVGVMFADEIIPGERYFVGNRMKFYLMSVEQTTRGLLVALSRSHPRFIIRLFNNEVPEIADGIVEIKFIAREAGSRTKIAVASNTSSIDPIGACVGQKGTRVTTVTNELGEEEKIDIILWSDDPVNFISHALAPAKVEEVQIKPNQEARVLVAPDQQSLAIGRGGQNVRLAARLTGWHIEIRSTAKPDETIEGGQSTPANDKTEPMPAQESSSEERSESSEKSQENTEK